MQKAARGGFFICRHDSSALDVMHQLVDDLRLLLNGGVHQIANRQHAQHRFAFQHGQVTDVFSVISAMHWSEFCSGVTYTTLLVMMSRMRVPAEVRPCNTMRRA
jgi:hypothetical protein